MKTGQHNFSSTPVLLQLNLFLFLRSAKAAPCTRCEPAPSRVLETRSRQSGPGAWRGPHSPPLLLPPRLRDGDSQGLLRQSRLPSAAYTDLSQPPPQKPEPGDGRIPVQPPGPASHRPPPSARARTRAGSDPRGAPPPRHLRLRPPAAGTPRRGTRLPGTRAAGAGRERSWAGGARTHPGARSADRRRRSPSGAAGRTESEGAVAGGLRPAPQGQSGGGMAASRPSRRREGREDERADGQPGGGATGRASPPRPQPWPRGEPLPSSASPFPWI
ncbi:uncharacterized protein LOC120765823 [Hirundo rustica]|uniref:uncharacterized protein LOC120765823 n=1 Tax=Hirundo rustica TaxID=43150 RepID=UPI001A944F7C|nr:uncharacterized protein LOC120765823 [Hirundo rustica]